MSNNVKHPPLKGFLVSDTAIKQPVFVTMLMLLGVVVGFLAFRTMPVDLIPDIDIPIVTVQVAYPGAGPESVADQVAKPIEDELSTLSGVDTITSNSAEGFATIIVEFAQEVDVDLAVQDVREKVTGVRARLPQDIEEPVYERIDLNASPILTLAVSSNGGQDGESLRRLLEDEIVPSIQRAEGVGSTTLTGGRERQINVNLDLARLQSLRILPAQVSQAIAQANYNVGVGDTLVGDQEFNLRTPSVFDTPEDIAAVGIGNMGYTVGDVAQIEDGQTEVETYARLDGTDTIILDIRKQSGTNTVAVSDAAVAEIEEVFVNYPDLRYEVIVDDAEEVRANVNSALEEIVLAVIFAMLVVWVFFRNFRNTIVTILGLPVILICTFAGMALFGISINIVSLLALSISVGLVIDDAIVIRENIFRHIERGEHPIIAASRGTAQVTGAVFAMTLTIVVVFVPVTFTSGITGVIFQSIGLTIAIAMVISLVEAFTLAPTTAAYWSSQHKFTPPKIKPGEEHLPDEAHEELGRSERIYARILDWSLHHRVMMVGIAALVAAGSFYTTRGLEFAFFPESDGSQFGMELELAPGTPLAETDRWARQVEEALLADPEIETVLTTVGDTGGLAGGGGAERATFLVSVSDDTTPLAVQARMRPQFADVPGMMFGKPSYQAGTGTDVSNRPLLVQVRGIGELKELAPIADNLVASFADIPGLYDVDTTYNPGKPELQYNLQQARANDYGLTNQDLATTMRTLVDGDTTATYREAGEDYDIVVQLRPEDRRSVEELGAVRLPFGDEDVLLNSIANVEVASSPTTIRRVDRQVEILIGGNNIDRNQNAVQADMQAQLANVAVPQGVRVSFAGATEDQQEGFQSLLLAMLLSVTFVYMVLASQFSSFTQPLVIMLAMPLSFVGAFLALRITGLELDILAMIGMLMLLGLVVKNSILVVDFTNQLRAAGMDKHAALTRASALRLRPILMTSLSLVFAAFPAAIGLGEGAALRQGLSTVVIGGMLASTMLTLLLIPTAYSLMEGFTDWLSRVFRRLGLSRDVTMAPQLAPAGAMANGASAPEPAHTNQTDSASIRQYSAKDGPPVQQHEPDNVVPLEDSRDHT